MNAEEWQQVYVESEPLGDLRSAVAWKLAEVAKGPRLIAVWSEALEALGADYPELTLEQAVEGRESLAQALWCRPVGPDHYALTYPAGVRALEAVA